MRHTRIFKLFANSQKVEQTYPPKEPRIIDLKETKISPIDNKFAKRPLGQIPKNKQKKTQKVFKKRSIYIYPLEYPKILVLGGG